MTEGVGGDLTWMWVTIIVVAVILLIVVVTWGEKLNRDPFETDEPEFLVGKDDDGKAIQINSRTGEVTPLDKRPRDGVRFK